MKRTITAEGVAAAIGPYSHGYRAGNFVYTSGQLPVDLSGNIVDGGITGQTARCLDCVELVLKAGGAGLADVVSVTVFLSDMENFAAMNKVYADYFEKDYPARICVEAARLPKDVLVEIQATAYVE